MHLALEKGELRNWGKSPNSLETCEGVDTMLMHSLRGGGFDGESQC